MDEMNAVSALGRNPPDFVVRNAVWLLLLLGPPSGLVTIRNGAEANLAQSRFAQVGGRDRRLAAYDQEQTLAYSRRSCTSGAADPATCDPQSTTPVMTVSDCGGWCRSVLSANCSAFSLQDDPEGGVVGCRIGSNATAATEAARGARTFAKNPVSPAGWATLNTACKYDEECTGQPLMTCQESRCKCPQTHVASPDQRQCLLNAWLATPPGTCTESAQCNSPTDLQCSLGQCACKVGGGMMFADDCVLVAATTKNITATYVLKYPASGNYANNEDRWRCVQGPRGTVVRATSGAIWGLESGHDAVQVFDGCGINDKVLLATSYFNMYGLVSSKNRMMVHFFSDSITTGTGFNLQFTVG